MSRDKRFRQQPCPRGRSSVHERQRSHHASIRMPALLGRNSHLGLVRSQSFVLLRPEAIFRRSPVRSSSTFPAEAFIGLTKPDQSPISDQYPRFAPMYSQRRKPPTKAFSLSPRRHFGGSSNSSLAFPPPKTT